MPPPPPRKVGAFQLPSHCLNTNPQSCLTIPALRERWDFAQRGPRSTPHRHTYSSKQPGCNAEPARTQPAAELSGTVKSDVQRAPFPLSPYRRDLCKMQFLNRHTEIEIVCCLNDILLLFQMLQPGQLMLPGNTSALHHPLCFTSLSLFL